jgi:hypothetical protein
VGFMIPVDEGEFTGKSSRPDLAGDRDGTASHVVTGGGEEANLVQVLGF